jgi:hypothetical protein
MSNIGPLEILVLLGILGLSFWVARLAQRKGYSFGLFFVLALLLSFLVALILVLVLPDRTKHRGTAT